MRLESPGVHALVLDCAHNDFSGVDVFLPSMPNVGTKEAIPDASGEGQV
jgi:hypothetical protein